MGQIGRSLCDGAIEEGGTFPLISQVQFLGPMSYNDNRKINRRRSIILFYLHRVHSKEVKLKGAIRLGGLCIVLTKDNKLWRVT